MAYNYLDIVNKVLLGFNEVPLTSSNFSSAVGFQMHVQQMVNSSINHIYYDQRGAWPFARVFTSQTLTVPSGVPTVIYYTLPAGCESVDWDSFYIKNTTINAQTWTDLNRTLPLMDIDQYRKYARTQDQMQPVNTWTAATQQAPTRVVRFDNNKWSVTPVPSQAYVIEFDYYAAPTALSLYSDVPAIPALYEQVIIDGTIYYAYLFRDNADEAGLADRRFRDGIDAMRRELINEMSYARFSD